MSWRVATTGVLLCLIGPARAQETSKEAVAGEIAKLTRAFEAAFEMTKLAELEDLFTEDAKLITEEGETFVGREAIIGRFAQVLTEGINPTIRCETRWLEVVGPDVAVEEGVATLQTGNPRDSPEIVPYTAVYVRRDGAWKHALVRDHPSEKKAAVAAGRQELESLEFLEGEWMGESPDGLLKVEGYSGNDGFLELRYQVVAEGETVARGEIRLAWDAARGLLRSWEFNSTGAFGEGTWTRIDEGRWLTQSTLTSADGEVTHAARLLERLDAHRVSWRRLGGEDSTAADAILLTWRPPLPGTGLKPAKP